MRTAAGEFVGKEADAATNQSCQGEKIVVSGKK